MSEGQPEVSAEFLGAYLLYTAAETAKVLRVSKSHVQKMAASGELRSVRAGRRVLFPRAAVLEAAGLDPEVDEATA